MYRTSDRPSAFTLIEVILALALAGVVITLAGQSAVHSLRTERRVQNDIFQRAGSRHVLDGIRSVWAQRLDAPIRVGLDPNLRQTVGWTALLPVDSENVWRRRLPCSVTFRLRRDQDGTFTLIKSIADLTRANTHAREQVVASGIRDFAVEAYDGRRWLKPEEVSDETEVAAVRLTLQMSNDQSESMTLIAQVPARTES